MMGDPSKPWVERLILQQCYVRNSAAVQAHFRAMSAKDMHRLLRE